MKVKEILYKVYISCFMCYSFADKIKKRKKKKKKKEKKRENKGDFKCTYIK